MLLLLWYRMMEAAQDDQARFVLEPIQFDINEVVCGRWGWMKFLSYLLLLELVLFWGILSYFGILK